jgi:hypothetical protein
VVDPTTQAGAKDWIVDGVDVLYQQWFWYRIGNTPEQSIDTIGNLVVTNPLPNIAVLAYHNDSIKVGVTYVLTGGTPGSATSDVGETISIQNIGRTNLDLHFFQYSDFDLSPTLVDNVSIDPTHHIAHQTPTGGGIALSETVVTPPASRAEANYFATTLNELNDGSPTNLNNVLTAGAGDVTWAFQWDKSIAPGGSFIISKDKNLQPVPEPAAIAMLGGVLLAVASKLRKRTA